MITSLGREIEVLKAKTVEDDTDDFAKMAALESPDRLRELKPSNIRRAFFDGLDFTRPTSSIGTQVSKIVTEGGTQTEVTGDVEVVRVAFDEPSRSPTPARTEDQICTECGLVDHQMLSVCNRCVRSITHIRSAGRRSSSPLSCVRSSMSSSPLGRHLSNAFYEDKLSSIPFTRVSPTAVFGPRDIQLTLGQELQILEKHDSLVSKGEKERKAITETEAEEFSIIREAFCKEIFEVGRCVQRSEVQASEQSARKQIEEMESEWRGWVQNSKTSLQRSYNLSISHKDEMKKKEWETILFISAMMDSLITEERVQRTFIAGLEGEMRIMSVRSGNMFSSSERASQKLSRQCIENQLKKCVIETERNVKNLQRLERNQGYERRHIEMKAEEHFEQIIERHNEAVTRHPMATTATKTGLATSVSGRTRRQSLSTVGNIAMQSSTKEVKGKASDPEFISRMMNAASKCQKSGTSAKHQEVAPKSILQTSNNTNPNIVVGGCWVEDPSNLLLKSNVKSSSDQFHSGSTFQIRSDSASPPPSISVSMKERSASVGRESSICSRRGLSPVSSSSLNYRTPVVNKKQYHQGSLIRSYSQTPQTPISHWAYDYDFGKEWTQLRETVLHASPSMGLKIAQISDSKDKEGIFKVAHQSLKAILSSAIHDKSFLPGEKWNLTPESVERIPRHARTNVLRALRDIVCAYDMMRPTQKKNLLTVEEIQNNVSSLILLARWSQQAFYCSGSRSSTPPPSTPRLPSLSRSKSHSPGFSIGRHSTYIPVL
eukprot:TRINITY_DN3282_c0_g3_i1.p1 TRINITY_DN3282_c0_g3~~TRINITY_DN3282_c0_g3_i1.p1  ORF type:complete len:898 (+),score=184.23 TRINITY_DN3282_c0_g3_i1:379-2694(+)